MATRRCRLDRFRPELKLSGPMLYEIDTVPTSAPMKAFEHGLISSRLDCRWARVDQGERDQLRGMTLIR